MKSIVEFFDPVLFGLKNQNRGFSVVLFVPSVIFGHFESTMKPLFYTFYQSAIGWHEGIGPQIWKNGRKT